MRPEHPCVLKSPTTLAHFGGSFPGAAPSVLSMASSTAFFGFLIDSSIVFVPLCIKSFIAAHFLCFLTFRVPNAALP